MGVIRGKIWHPKIFPRVHLVGGPSPFAKCECGKWINRETGEHLQSISLQEWMKKEKPTCPDKKKGE